MERVVASGGERCLARLTLRDDPFSHRLRPGDQQRAIDYALSAGEAAADLARGRWGQGPEEIAGVLKLSIKHSNDPAQSGRSVLFSEYGDRPPSITLYDRSIGEANSLIQVHRLEGLIGLADVAPVHLAHELYHHLEGQRLIPGTKAYRVETHRLGPIRFRTTLPSLCEIAADRFASVLLDLKVPPKALQFITLYRLNPNYAWQQASAIFTTME